MQDKKKERRKGVTMVFCIRRGFSWGVQEKRGDDRVKKKRRKG